MSLPGIQNKLNSHNLVDYDSIYSNFNFNTVKAADINGIYFGQKNPLAHVIDRYLNHPFKNKTALIWEGDSDSQQFTFGQLAKLSSKVANLLTRKGVVKGDRVFIYLPRIPEIYYSFYGIAKVGAIPGTLFPAFGEAALLDRLANSGAKVLITNQELAKRLDSIKDKLPLLETILVIEDFQNLLPILPDTYDASEVKENDPQFMLYTSATGNTPVCGIVVPQKALIQQILTAKWVLDLREDDIYWCTADPGWVTGLVYGLIAPFALGVTQLAYEGRFSADKWLALIKKHCISILYTSPTALRMIEAEEKNINKEDLVSIRNICSVGEALTPSTSDFVKEKMGKEIHDTYWQTETGSMMVTNFPSLPIKTGSMGKPVPGVKAAVIDEQGYALPAGSEGELAFSKGWPSMMTDVWGNKERYESYFLGDWFVTGDRAKIDNDGYIWFVGRANDIIKTSGERVGPFDVESALNQHPYILESAVIGKPDKLRGEIIKAFIVLKKSAPLDIKDTAIKEKFLKELIKFTKKELAGHEYPREIEFVDELPKNRSGKIVRRILKARELGLSLGDISTLVQSAS